MSEREESLDRRVRWLDRYRRLLAIAVGGTSAAFVWWELSAPPLSLSAAMVVWLLTEVGIAWLTAFWETELNALQAARGLPRAEVRDRRWWRR